MLLLLQFSPCLPFWANGSLGALRACTQTLAAQTHNRHARLPCRTPLIFCLCWHALVLLHKTCWKPVDSLIFCQETLNAKQGKMIMTWQFIRKGLILQGAESRRQRDDEGAWCAAGLIPPTSAALSLLRFGAHGSNTASLGRPSSASQAAKRQWVSLKSCRFKKIIIVKTFWFEF